MVFSVLLETLEIFLREISFLSILSNYVIINNVTAAIVIGFLPSK